MRSQNLSILLLVFALVAAKSGIARTLHVPEVFQTIQTGIDSSQNGDTVLVQPGVYEENLVIGNRTVVLASLMLLTDDPQYITSTIIDGREQGSVINLIDQISLTTIKGFTIRNGRTDESGGGICFTSDRDWDNPACFEDLLITNNSAAVNGGGVYLHTNYRIFSRVKCISNHAGDQGGGAHMRPTRLSDCEFRDNEAGNLGGGLYGLYMGNLHSVLVEGNRAGTNYGGIFTAENNGNGVYYDRVTVVYNVAPEGQIGGASIRTGMDGGGYVFNSIFRRNSSCQLEFSPTLDHTCRISFSDIEGGQNGIRSRDGGYDYLETNIDVDPEFVDAENGDFRISVRSPCIDTGDPANTDPDGTAADMGAFYYPQNGAVICGFVTDRATGASIPFTKVLVSGQNGDTVAVSRTNLDGWWHKNIPMPISPLQIEVSALAADYPGSRLDTVVNDGDSVVINMALDRAVIESSIDSINAELGGRCSQEYPFTLRNTGNAAVNWNSVIRRGEITGNSPLSLVREIRVNPGVDYYGFRGVAFDGERYYLSGYCYNGDPTQLLQVTDRTGEVLRSIPAPGPYGGVGDLEWDGEWLWGTAGDSIYAWNPDGDLMRCFLNRGRTYGIAYDPNSEVLWLDKQSDEIIAVDRDGRALGPRLADRGLPIMGMGWDGEAPDGYKLILTCYIPNTDSRYVMKMNPETGDTLRVGVCPGLYGNGGYVCKNYDAYSDIVLMMVYYFRGIVILNLRPNTEWLSLDIEHAELAPGEEQALTLTLYTAAEDSSWVFATGDYTGNVRFDYVGPCGGFDIPISLHVDADQSVTVDHPDSPTFLLDSAFPNPFNSTATISYQLPTTSDVSVDVVDISGRLVTELARGRGSAGRHRVVWNAENTPAGLYLVRVQAGEQRLARKVVLVK